MQIIDGFRDEVHITSQQVADSYIGLVGKDDYVLPVGNNFDGDFINGNNQFQVEDGVALIQGRRVSIEAGQTEIVISEDNNIGTTRKDLVILRYTKAPATLIESIEVVCVKGEDNSGDPDINDNTVIRNGALIHDFALYRINRASSGATSVDKLFTPISQVYLPNGVLPSLLKNWTNADVNRIIPDSSITNAKLAGGISNAKLAGGISNDKLAGGISNDKLAGGISNDKLAGGITRNKISPSFIQTGTNSISIEQDDYIHGQIINFSTPMATIPIVNIMITRSADAANATFRPEYLILNLTNTGFEIYARNAANYSRTMNFTWMAIAR